MSPPQPPPALPPGSRGRRALDLRTALARLSGARLCYGRPVSVGKRTVIPVASVQLIGGAGAGDSTGDSPSSGGGGGGWLTATPVGYIEATPERARFRPIVDPLSLLRALVTVGALAATWRGAALRTRRRREARRRSPRRSLRR